MAVVFKQTTTQSDQLVPLMHLGPAYPNFAALPDPTLYPNRVALLQASTSPNAPCMVVSDGVSWFPISISATPVS